MPLAKYVALHQNELTFPFRRFQIGKVYRGERAQRGRFREFCLTQSVHHTLHLDLPPGEQLHNLAKGGGETEKQIYRFTKGDTDLSLRFDLTVPLAK